MLDNDRVNAGSEKLRKLISDLVTLPRPDQAEVAPELGTWAPARLKLLRRTTVGRQHPALLLMVAGYPDGGVHGGHLAVVWNQGTDGYTLSMHFAERSKRDRLEQEAVLLQAATAMSRFAAPSAG